MDTSQILSDESEFVDVEHMNIGEKKYLNNRRLIELKCIMKQEREN
jgi:hypothetical protein